MTGQILGTMRRLASIMVGLGLVLVAAAHAGEVTLRSNRRVKVNVGGRRVIGTFQPEDAIYVEGLGRGTHKIYVKDIASGGFDLVFVDMPAQEGEEIRVDFGTRVDTTLSAPGRGSAPAPIPSRAEQPAQIAETGAWRGEMGKLFDLHEVSLDTLEAMQGQLDRMKDQIVAGNAVNSVFSGAPPALEVDSSGGGGRRLKTYLYVDSEYSETTAPGDKGSFDQHHVYLGATGDIDSNWSGRVEMEFEHGYTNTGTGTVGSGRVERAFLTRKGGTTTFTLGKIFNPFGFFNAVSQEIFNDTVQNPLQFENLYSSTQTGAHWQFNRQGNQLSIGLFNGDGPTPDQTDTNDDKSFVASWGRDDFMNGRVALSYNRQRDGNQGNRREEKWILSTEQKWDKIRLLGEYFLENAGQAGPVTNNDAFYTDLRYDITDKWNTTLRYDWIRRDPKAANGEHTRKLINFGYQFGPALRFKADFYRDAFPGAAPGAVRGQNGMDLQLAAAIGL